MLGEGSEVTEILRSASGRYLTVARSARDDLRDRPLDGLKLLGFAIWERKTGGRNVTFPARQYSVNGERRSFALLRPIVDTTSQDKLRDLVLEAYKDHEAEIANLS
jgi:hypothetical protein